MTVQELDALWDFGDPKGSETRFREAITSLADDSLCAEARTQLARSLGLQRRFEEANQVLEQVEIVGPRVRVRWLLEKGRVLNSSGNPTQAKPLFIEAYELGQSEALDGLAVDAAHMIAIVSDSEEALDWNLKAIEYAQASNDPTARKWLASLYNNTGWTLHDSGRFDEALDLFTKARALREERGEVENERIARWCIARCLRSLGKLNEALVIQQDLDRENPDNDGFVDEELGELLLAMGQPDEAKNHFAKAFNRLSQDPWFVNNEPNRLARLKELGGDSLSEN